ncbi:MAG: SGNH/GDSL hydrolase family protein [Ruthenibacterium sp.]
MKNILCFGDSNTFGTNPSGGRWKRWERWTGKLQQLLGSEWYVIEEGCGGRTTVWDDCLELHKNGREALPVSLATHKPLDFVIILLGTNDLKSRFNALPADIANGAGQLAQMVKDYDYGPDYRVPQVLLISPIELGADVEHSIYTGFENTAVEKSRQVAAFFENQAKQLGCLFLDAATVAKPSSRDMLHMEAADHAALAQEIAKIICSNA